MAQKLDQPPIRESILILSFRVPRHGRLIGRVGRRACALDIEPRYVDVAIRRWQTFTRRDAIHIETGATFDDLTDRAIQPSSNFS